MPGDMAAESAHRTGVTDLSYDKQACAVRRLPPSRFDHLQQYNTTDQRIASENRSQANSKGGRTGSRCPERLDRHNLAPAPDHRRASCRVGSVVLFLPSEGQNVNTVYTPRGTVGVVVHVTAEACEGALGTR